ncbi:hypothetical protein [Nesterenkonia pannonica]|nr:hypothetical protein [Nesterenkonia pannonica]
MLTFDRADLLQPILNGTAASVELNPLPEHGLPVRRQCRLAAGLSLPPALRRKIRSEYRRAGVSGRLVLREPEPRLVVAGEEKSVREWFRRIARVLGEEFSQVEEYTGPVHLGFGVSE